MKIQQYITLCYNSIFTLQCIFILSYDNVFILCYDIICTLCCDTGFYVMITYLYYSYNVLEIYVCMKLYKVPVLQGVQLKID